MIRRWLKHPIVDVALKALGRNRLQTGLTLLGMTIGVATERQGSDLRPSARRIFSA